MNALTNRLFRDHTYIDRALRNKHYERARDGLRLRNGLFIGGHAEVRVNDGPALIAPNLVVDQGINYLLGAGILAVTQDGQWHLAPYSGTTSVAGTLTAAAFTGTQTEFTNYAESARPNWTAVAGTRSLTNSASPAVITINADNQTIRGLGVISVGTKSASSGILLAAVPFAAARSGLNTNDTLSLVYTLTGANDGV